MTSEPPRTEPWDGSPLDKVSEAETENFRQSKDLLKDDLPYFARAFALYNPPFTETPENLLVAFQLLQTSRHCFVKAAMAIMRCHIADGFGHTRRAIEATSYAFQAKDPEVAKVWIGKSWHDKEYRERLRAVKFPKDHAVLSGLEERWKKSSEIGSHVTISSEARKVSYEENGVSVGFFDVHAEVTEEVISTFHWTVQTHLLLLSVFVEVFSGTFPADTKARLDQLQADHERYCRGPVAQRLGYRQDGVLRTASGIVLPETGQFMRLLQELMGPRR